MNFKKRLITLGIMGVFVSVVLIVSLYAIFANGNLLVKTNVSVSYSAPSLDSAFVSTKSWRMGDSGKTEYLTPTNAENLTDASQITTELTEEYTYVVYEFILENRSNTSTYYFQVTYTDDTTPDGNMVVKYCSSAGAPIEVEDILSSNLKTLRGYYWGGSTIIENNIVASAGQTVYAYVLVKIDDTYYQGSFSGSFLCNISMATFSTVDQDKTVYYGTVNGYSTEPIYYIKKGEMPQRWAGTDDSQFALTEEIYTEFGVDYPIYVDSLGDRFAKKDGAYYKMEAIIWQVVGLRNAGQEDDSRELFYSNNVYDSTQFSKKTKSSLIVISTKVLFYSEWNSTLTRVNYPNSTIYSKLNEFYNDVSIGGNSSNTIYYNNVENYSTVLIDYTDAPYQAGTVSTKLWLFKKNNVTNWASYAINFSSTVFPTSWAAGSETVDYTNWWLRTNQYNLINNESVYRALYITTRGTILGKGTDITEVMGVRPAMSVSL